MAPIQNLDFLQTTKKTMVTITPVVDHESYEINGKRIYKDSNGEWMSNGDLTSTEKNAFANYQKAVINNPAFKKHTKSIYKPKAP